MVVYSRNLNANEVFAGYDALSQPAESYGNSEQVEYMWARSAYEHAEIHYDLLLSVDAKLLRLTPIDEEIYKHFKEQFPDFKLDVISEDFLKSPQQKELWREFCEQYKTRIENYNFATLLRLRCDQDYSPDNTTLAPRIQFYAIEIARNREGLNDEIRKKIKTELPPQTQSLNNNEKQ
ncbi:protein PBDC1 [Planococcus citri]|uniref:protein PBDC1 n=1 Tax=Planococcus citri TaxID=170843 RepID=UPI0031F91A2F